MFFNFRLRNFQTLSIKFKFREHGGKYFIIMTVQDGNRYYLQINLKHLLQKLLFIYQMDFKLK